jgi:LmbE family N-acetylglucosaminyl deacetylase
MERATHQEVIMINKSLSILVIAAHPDDEVLGCGGTIARLTEEGHSAHFAILGEGITSRQNQAATEVDHALSNLKNDAQAAAKAVGAKSLDLVSFPDNRFDSVPLLDIVHAVEGLKKSYDPDIIFTHHPGDLNIDHLCTFRAVLTAFRPLPEEKPRTIYCFEVPSSTEWQTPQLSPSFIPNHFTSLEERHLKAKIEAMESYRSERRESPHPRSPESLRALATWRGSIIGRQFAEAFSLARSVN